MIYVTSDLHGYPLEQFQALLQRAGFTQDDFLFVLGDVIDRGKDGIRLLRWLVRQPNMQLILGNHEAMLLSCLFLFDPVADDRADILTQDQMDLLSNWIYNGAQPTLNGLQRLLDTDPQTLEGIICYLQEAPLYEVVTAGGRDFVLTHAGLGNFRPDRPLSDYRPDELYWTRPNLDTRYFEDTMVIFGHTPTLYLDPARTGQEVRTDSWICIDSGAAANLHPMLLRLDDLKAFY